MISLRKLASLREETRLRKSAWICREVSEQLLRGESADFIFIHGLGRQLGFELLPEEILKNAKLLNDWEPNASREDLARLLDSMYYLISAHLGTTPGDWDLKDRAGTLNQAERLVRPFRVYLDDIRSPFNVGSVFRTSEAFGVEKIFLSTATPTPDHPRVRRTAMGCDEVIPWDRRGLDSLEDESAVFALELGGTDIGNFEFPESGVVILGSEELGLSPAAQEIVERKGGRVSIPMLGAKGSVNVSVAFGILMYAWNSYCCSSR
ncbi:MAG: TrmH family RNA methyltransferase [Spirochaetales bacterium]|nr:TrmH family RNA methyltransferase [Spirochaetales bacterium]